MAPAIVLLGTVALVAGGGYWWWNGSRDDDQIRAVVKPVVKSDFILTVTERGELESAENVEIRCEVKSKNTTGTAILRLAEEGKWVEEGDFLVEFDSSALRDERTQQQILVNTAKAVMIESRNLYETAVISETEYIEGTFKQEKQLIEGEIFVAEENLRRAQEYYQYSQQLAAKGYVTQLQLEADRFAVENARKVLETAQTKLEVLERFTREKMIKQLESTIVSTEAKSKADENSYNLEQAKLDEINLQIEKCVVTAPTKGQIKYAHDYEGRGDAEFIVEEGAVCRELQPVIHLPNPNRMQADLKINESMIEMIREGMPATVRLVGLKDAILPGRVTKINQYSEPPSWRSGGVREYTVFVELDGTTSRLKTGMTAEVTIECQRISEALQVPVQALYAHGRDFYCIVTTERGPEARRVKIGATNDKFTVILEGLGEDEPVTVNPRDFVEVVDLPPLTVADMQQVVNRSPEPPSVLREGEGSDLPGDATPAMVVQQLLSEFDADRDGKLALQDLPEDRRVRFTQADSNGDELFDREEMLSALTETLGDSTVPSNPGAGG
ncbi:MAG: HlyD family efflux transporter periplasmic adaptor subunit [Pirellulales bacterium]